MPAFIRVDQWGLGRGVQNLTTDIADFTDGSNLVDSFPSVKSVISVVAIDRSQAKSCIR
jgi:hypothetical protein